MSGADVYIMLMLVLNAALGVLFGIALAHRNTVRRYQKVFALEVGVFKNLKAAHEEAPDNDVARQALASQVNRMLGVMEVGDAAVIPNPVIDREPKMRREPNLVEVTRP